MPFSCSFREFISRVYGYLFISRVYWLFVHFTSSFVPFSMAEAEPLYLGSSLFTIDDNYHMNYNSSDLRYHLNPRYNLPGFIKHSSGKRCTFPRQDCLCERHASLWHVTNCAWAFDDLQLVVDDFYKHFEEPCAPLDEVEQIESLPLDTAQRLYQFEETMNRFRSYTFGPSCQQFAQHAQWDDKMKWPVLKNSMRQWLAQAPIPVTEELLEANREHIYRVLYVCFCCCEVFFKSRVCHQNLPASFSEKPFLFPTASPSVFFKTVSIDFGDVPESWWLSVAELFCSML